MVSSAQLKHLTYIDMGLGTSVLNGWALRQSENPCMKARSLAPHGCFLYQRCSSFDEK